MSTLLTDKTATELAVLLQKREISAVEIATACLERVSAADAAIGAFLGVDADDFLAQARASDSRRAGGAPLGPLDGIPVALKDNIAAAGQPLSCASRILENYVSPYDATVTARLRAAGALVWGRLNMDEFAMGSSNENSAFKPVRNPHALSRVPGGSSGGSAAAVAAGFSPLALGSDTGGSIRQPAAFCGVAGMKPTYGRVSRHGLAAFASSLDQIGPIARSVADTALLLEAICGNDPRDGTSLAVPVPEFVNAVAAFDCGAARGTRGWRIGVPREFFAEGLAPSVRAAVEAAVEFYRMRGHSIVQVSLPATRYAVATYYVIAAAEASSNLARYDGIRYGRRSDAATDAVNIYEKSRAEGFGDEVKRRVILGTYVLTSGYYDAYYLRAQKVRTLIRDDFMRAFAEADFLLTPVSPVPPPLLGVKDTDLLAQYLADIYTIPVNLAGLPAMSIPCKPAPAAVAGGDLPAAFQLIGKPLDEMTLLLAAREYECEHPFPPPAPGGAPIP
ncbi:MAG: Asp-tRNA(Asn)/Glu-tRNA(Gln) amidotransferase subunit GatA [Puniceicoccales bacterium]|nr:Asp-tRNA(Asn)/Glu-tRNA(Gln) amidotransferase subunit GatA [Puniceicoccales bacterium]